MIVYFLPLERECGR